MVGMYIALAVFGHLALLQATPSLPINPVSWIPIALLVALTVIVVASFTYMLSGIINSERARMWSRFQIYEALLSILLIGAFGSLSFLFFLNPQPVFSAINVVPPPCTSAKQLHSLASCDLGLFNTASFAFGRDVFYFDYMATLFLGIKTHASTRNLFGDTGVHFSVDMPPLFPKNIATLLLFSYDIILLMLVFNQLQLIILAGSVLFLGFFVTIGLIARTLGFLRTFGGAMIAFGLGIGIVYPLLISLTYGYVDVTANLACVAGLQQTAFNIGTLQISCGAFGMVQMLATTLFNWQVLTGTVPFISVAGSLFMYFGYILAGLTVIPVLNIAIVDAFIIDFSGAIGERMSFSQLFSNMI